MKQFQLLNGKTKTINKTIRDDAIEINQKIFEVIKSLRVMKLKLMTVCYYFQH